MTSSCDKSEFIVAASNEGTHQKNSYAKIEGGRSAPTKRLVGQLEWFLSEHYIAQQLVRADTYNGENEGNPHQEVEASKHVVKGFLPVVSRWRGDDVLPQLRLALDGGRVKPHLH